MTRINVLSVKPGPDSLRLPTGVVTFFFSDIEGSTQRWDANPQAMSDVVRRHDLILREAIEGSGGYVFKTVGDAFCAAFARSDDAVLAAYRAQRTLATESFSNVHGLPVRMAIHSGKAEEREADYFGAAVNRVARLLATAHGDQVLVSGTAAELLSDALPEGVTLRDLGRHRLKDLALPEQVFCLAAPDLRADFPPLRSLEALRNNLPHQLTHFIGRESEVSDIKALISASRLVTLFGAGGMGKTRCALQIGADLLDGEGDGVWFVDLASISDPTLVATAIAKALSIAESANVPLIDTLVSHVRDKYLLLILDNCEHVIQGAAQVAEALLRACPRAHILATSREALGVPGESVFRMPPLAMSGAIALFSERARAANADFALDESTLPIVEDICKRLDGIALAIELAAARTTTLHIRELSARLQERFRLLTGGSRTALPRQQTMRALIDWSYDLLLDEERACFRRLGVFAGTFTVASAAALCRAMGFDELATDDCLSSLVNKSLVLSDSTARETRYRLLESMRAYARERLVQEREDATTERDFAQRYLQLAEDMDVAWAISKDHAWLAYVEPELDNWRSVLEWALTGERDVQLGQRLVGAMQRAWANLAASEGRRWVRVASDGVTAKTPPSIIARLDLTDALLNAMLSQYKPSYTSAQRALARYRELDDPQGVAEAQRHSGRALIFMGRLSEGERILREALESARKLDAQRLVGATLVDLATARQFEDDVDAARQLFGEALTVFQLTGAERLVASIAANLAEAEFRAGRPDAAIALAEEALAGHRLQKNAQFEANDLSNIAAYLVALDRFDEASARGREALMLALQAQDDVIAAWSLQHLAASAALRNEAASERSQTRFITAARLLGYLDRCFEVLEAPREYTEEREAERMRDALASALGEEALSAYQAEGRLWNARRAVDQALADV